jgi:hypothetical protein
MSDNDRAYYENRISVEVELSLKAESSDARAVHRQFAQLYRARLDDHAGVERRS